MMIISILLVYNLADCSASAGGMFADADVGFCRPIRLSLARLDPDVKSPCLVIEKVAIC